MSVFRAYDIRGVFGDELDLDTVYRIGRILPGWLPARRIVVGRDVRLSSVDVRDALCRGLVEAGCAVDDLGAVSTPAVYYMTRHGNYDASAQVTASHNPPQYNGIKLSRGDLMPVGIETGMPDLAARVLRSELSPKALSPGSIRVIDGIGPYLDYLRPQLPPLEDVDVVLDCGGGMAALTLPPLLGDRVRWRNTIPDGTFSVHSPNPMDPDSRTQVVADVRAGRLCAGLVFDGDADRVVMVDERGEFVRPDLMTGVLAAAVLRKHPGSGILNDVRTSRGVLEGIARLGGIWHMGPVGHAYAKPRMRTLGTLLGGELAAHYYFRDFFGCDSGELAALRMLDVLVDARRNGETLSDRVAFFGGYANTGERNYRVRDRRRAMAAVCAVLQKTETVVDTVRLDGERLEFEDGWVNVRRSNTEPYLRLIGESRSADRLAIRWARIETALAPWREECDGRTERGSE